MMGMWGQRWLCYLGFEILGGKGGVLDILYFACKDGKVKRHWYQHEGDEVWDFGSSSLDVYCGWEQI
jgi:hypothetical protein